MAEDDFYHLAASYLKVAYLFFVLEDTLVNWNIKVRSTGTKATSGVEDDEAEDTSLKIEEIQVSGGLI